MSKFYVHRGMILRKEAPKGFKRGDSLELKLGFVPASTEEMTKALGTGDVPEGYIAGWASTGSRDHYNHEIKGGAFQAAMDSRGLTGPRGIKLLLDHEWTQPAGVIKVLEYRRDKLWIEAQMNLSVSYVRERWEMLKMMGGANFSVGFMLQDYDVVVREEGDGDEDVFLQINRGDLFEISIVLFPGNEEAQMTFVKARLNDDNPSEDEVFFAKAATPLWKMGASRNLPFAQTEAWDGAAAKSRVFKAAGFDTAKPDFEMLKKAFLAYDAANPTLKSSYKLLFADIVDGKLKATSAGISAAAPRLALTDIPDTVKEAARPILDAYQEEEATQLSSSKAAPKSQNEFEKLLVARGLVKGRNDARAIAHLVKSCPEIFTKKTEDIRPQEPALDVGKLTATLLAVKKLNASIAPAATS